MSNAKKKRAKKTAKAGAAPPAPTPRGPGQPPRPITPTTVTALEAGVVAICAMFGIAADDLVGRVRQITVRDRASAALRKLALGAVSTLGRDLGLSWSGMSSEVMPDFLRAAHKTTLGSFHDQFLAWTGMNVDGRGTTGKPVGEVAAFVRDRYLQIKRDALVAAAGKSAA